MIMIDAEARHHKRPPVLQMAQRISDDGARLPGQVALPGGKKLNVMA